MWEVREPLAKDFYEELDVFSGKPLAAGEVEISELSKVTCPQSGHSPVNPKKNLI